MGYIYVATARVQEILQSLSFSQCVFIGLAGFIGFIGLAVWQLRNYLIHPYITQLRNLPGPPSESWIFGNLRTLRREPNSEPQERWMEQYHSHSLMYRGILNKDRLWTIDTRAINHILTHSVDYQKPEQARRVLAQVLGEGVLVTEAEQHRQQRRVMNPAFGPSQIRELTDIFLDKSLELRDRWDSEVAQHGEPARIDVLSWLSKTTLDIIGLAGFNYRFDTLNPDGKPNELNEAFNEIFDPDPKITPLMILREISPIFHLIPDARSRRVNEAQGVMRKIGMQLIAEKKAAILAEQNAEKYAGVERKDMSSARDLLTLLLKANMATDIPESQRLSDEDVLAQVPTFLVAGHETTSTATVWCLFALTQAPEVQCKLREELLTIGTERPTMDELNALPYLDAVVRETLRVHAPVPSSMRVAKKDDVIPVTEPFVDRFGVVQDSIKISEGSMIIIPILALNRAKHLWGADAKEFKPERWENVPEGTASIPGVWSHLLTFIGGPRACIGYRFTLIEMKALIFTLVRAFEFELAVPASDVQKKATVVQRPIILSAKEQGSHMPLLVKRYTQ